MKSLSRRRLSSRRLFEGRFSRARSVPAASLRGAQLVHIGGGETVTFTPASDDHVDGPLAGSRLALPPARVHVLEDVLICPGSRVVATARGEVVAESFASELRPTPSVPPEIGTVPVYYPGAVAYFRSAARGHYHTLVDDLPRAALLNHAAMRRLGTITVVHDGPLSAVEAYLLPRLLGRNLRLVQVDPHTAVTGDVVLLPGHLTRAGAGAVPSWYVRALDRCATHAPPVDGPARMFIIRPTGARQIGNWDAVSEVLDRHDVEAVDLPALTAAEQVARFRDADLVVGVHGGGLANALFSQSARVVELLPSDAPLRRYSYLSASRGLEYRAVAGVDRHPSSRDRLSLTVEVDVAALDRALAAASLR
jgi:Glycosyltransferase 61